MLQRQSKSADRGKKAAAGRRRRSSSWRLYSEGGRRRRQPLSQQHLSSAACFGAHMPKPGSAAVRRQAAAAQVEMAGVGRWRAAVWRRSPNASQTRSKILTTGAVQHFRRPRCISRRLFRTVVLGMASCMIAGA